MWYAYYKHFLDNKQEKIDKMYSVFDMLLEKLYVTNKICSREVFYNEFNKLMILLKQDTHSVD